MAEVVELTHSTRQDGIAAHLVREMLRGNITEVKPAIDLTTELGFIYPQLESLLEMTTQETIAMLEFLANENVIEKHFHDKIMLCPYCHSPNLRPSVQCPKCGSADIAKGRVLEHFSCGNISLEDEYMVAGKYTCPKCKKRLRFLGTDYRSLGINHKCYNCGEISSQAVSKWQCLKCSLFCIAGGAKETVIYSYRISDEKKPWLESWLEFELGPKAQFIEFLKNRGYEVAERAKISSASKSGAEHMLDILAWRDDGFITYTVAIDVLNDSQGKEIGLEEVFKFDDKAYDLGIHDKVLLVVPRLSREAKQFAQRQRIKVFEGNELETFLASAISSISQRAQKDSFKFDTKAKFLGYLRSLGYRVEEKAKVQGRSGAKYTLDIVAYNDDGFISHTLGIGVIIAKGKVGLGAVSSFDTKAYDIGIHDKALLVSARLCHEARQFVQQQRIKVIEVDDPAKLM